MPTTCCVDEAPQMSSSYAATIGRRQSIITALLIDEYFLTIPGKLFDRKYVRIRKGLLVDRLDDCPVPAEDALVYFFDEDA